MGRQKSRLEKKRFMKSNPERVLACGWHRNRRSEQPELMPVVLGSKAGSCGWWIEVDRE